MKHPNLKTSIPYRKILFVAVAILCITPWVSSPVALVLGILTAALVGHPFEGKLSRPTKILLQASVVGLGFGMNLERAMEAGSQGILFTIITIAVTLLLGYLLGSALKIDNKTATLLSSGTAICGGSAIAAIAPIIQANEKQISVALGTVFLLNAAALLFFPAVGHYFQLTQEQFGWWAAISIHDTSSVVGAASKYGPEALEIATTIKLTRALWIIPLSLFYAALGRKNAGKIKFPYFILWFIAAMALSTYLAPVHAVSPYIVTAARAGLTLTLFLIGSSLSLKTIRAVGPKALILGICLWIVIMLGSLWVIMNYM